MKAYITVILSAVLVLSALAPAAFAAADSRQAVDALKAVKAFYMKDASDFAVDFKVNSKMKDISFDGTFMFKPPMNFAIEARSAALQLKIAFRDGNGFIYLPAANMITNLDKVAQTKTRSLQIPRSPAELDSRIENVTGDFDLSLTPGDQTKITGKSRKAKGSFDAFIDGKSSELKSVVTYNNKGEEVITLEVKNFRRVKVENSMFDKPQGAVETNLPVPIF